MGKNLIVGIDPDNVGNLTMGTLVGNAGNLSVGKLTEFDGSSRSGFDDLEHEEDKLLLNFCSRRCEV